MALFYLVSQHVHLQLGREREYSSHVPSDTWREAFQLTTFSVCVVSAAEDHR